MAKTLDIWTGMKKAIPTLELIPLPVNASGKLAKHSKLFLALEMSVQV